MRRIALVRIALSTFFSLACLALSPHGTYAGSALWSAPATAQSVISKTYIQAGGKGGLGIEQGEPIVWGSGCTQDYHGGRSKSAAIFVSSCASSSAPTPEVTPQKSSAIRSYIVRGEFWDYAKVQGSAVLGSPLSDDQVLDDGRWQTFAGGSWGLTELYQSADSDRVYAMRAQLREWYLANGGPSHTIGWPISDAYDWNGEVRQDFEFGSLVWRAETGVRPLVSWTNGQVMSSPTVDPASYVIRELHSYKITSETQLTRCYGGRSAVKSISPDELDLTQKKYTPQGNATECVTPQEQAAITWAKGQLKSTWSNQAGVNWSGRCETFIELAFGTRARAFSAAEHYQWRLKRGQIHTDQSAPAGTIVFYGGSSDGHVGLSLGDGLVISTQGYMGDRLPVWQHRLTGLSNPYLGWAYLDNTWPR